MDTSLAGVPKHPVKVYRPLTAIVLVKASRQGCYLCLIACVPRRRAHRAHAPLFEWTNAVHLQTRSRAPLFSAPSSGILFLLLHCFFSFAAGSK